MYITGFVIQFTFLAAFFWLNVMCADIAWTFRYVVLLFVIGVFNCRSEYNSNILFLVDLNCFYIQIKLKTKRKSTLFTPCMHGAAA